ncbi:MAG: hypothetical protein E4H14_15670 [Candidatus Thorarchaeota archaeon]|nr:MAG: hypothetical protein E4H14_15670 [Candidatus Thorarchaeota archaeon]
MKGKIGCFLFLILIGFGMVPVGSYYDHRFSHEDTKTLHDGAILSEVTFSTYIDGWNDDTIDCIVVDVFNNTYIAGRTRSSDLPSGGHLGFVYSGYNDYYVMKLNSFREIEYMTYVGADGPEGSPNLTPIGACSIDVDNLGRVYMTGTTASYYFPLVNPWEDEFGGFGDCFALRLSSTGDTLQYSTFLPGNRLDIGTAIQVDTSYNAYICGWTQSDDFPTLNAYDSDLSGNSDLFLLKLDSNGQLRFSTYVGGSGIESTQGTSSLFLDENRNCYIIGSTNSPDLYVSNHDIEYNGPSKDLFFMMISPFGAFLSGSYYGSPDADYVGGIWADDLGDIYLTGSTVGTLPFDYTIGPNPKAFVAKFTLTGALIHSTGFGGSDVNYPLGLFVDDEHCAFVTGYTDAPDFPLEDPIESTYHGLEDCFVVKLSGDGDRLLFSSYLGGNESDIGFAAALTPYNRIMVAGVSNSSDFESINQSIVANHQLYGFIVEFEDIWEDIPLPTSTVTATTSIIPTPSTTTSLPPNTSPEPDSPLFINSILLTVLAIELIILFSMVQRIRRNLHA